MVNPIFRRRSVRLIPSILSGAFAAIMLAGGVSSSLVAGEIDDAMEDPYQSLLVWGVFALEFCRHGGFRVLGGPPGSG